MIILMAMSLLLLISNYRWSLKPFNTHCCFSISSSGSVTKDCKASLSKSYTKNCMTCLGNIIYSSMSLWFSINCHSCSDTVGDHVRHWYMFINTMVLRPLHLNSLWHGDIEQQYSDANVSFDHHKELQMIILMAMSLLFWQTEVLDQ
jgi:hypothetical protein